MAQHKNLTGDDLHEPKGIESASVDQVYVANGAGSGEWKDPFSRVLNLNEFDLTGVLDDVSTADSSFYIRVPRDGTMTSIFFVLSGTLTGTDAVVSLYRDGVMLGQTQTFPAAGSGDGIKSTLNLSPTYSFTEGQVLTVKSDGGSTNAVRLFFTAKFTAS